MAILIVRPTAALYHGWLEILWGTGTKLQTAAYRNFSRQSIRETGKQSPHDNEVRRPKSR
jgi:hypothetical protein